MKITFEFDTCAENFDKHKLDLVQNADDYYLALTEIWQYIRDQYKFYSENPDNIETIHDNIVDILNDYGVKVP